MIPFNLLSNRQLLMERDNNKLRLVVLENGQEWVCRKERFHNLENFIATTGSHIFKGRLQLFHENEKIIVVVKKEVIGEVNADKWKQAFDALKSY